MSIVRALSSMTLAVLLAAGAAPAQTERDKSENGNPHSTLNKDRPQTEADSATSKAQTQRGESANPDSTLNKDRVIPADADHARNLEQAEKGNPHSVKNKDQHKDEMSEGAPANAQGVLERMATADRGEIAMGKLAQQNGSSRVQEYGRMLEQDHSASLGEVQDLAKKKGLTLLAKDPMAKHEMEEAGETQGRLTRLHGPEFDKAFARAMVEDHKKDIDHLKKWQGAVQDKELSALIGKTLPVLERHLSAAQSLRAPAAQGRTP